MVAANRLLVLSNAAFGESGVAGAARCGCVSRWDYGRGPPWKNSSPVAPNWPPGSPLRRVGLLADGGDDPESVDADSVVVALHRYVSPDAVAAGDGRADRRGR